VKIKNREQLLVIMTAIVVSLYLGDRFVLTPLIEAWKERSERIAQLEKSISNGEYLIEREASVKARWNRMRGGSLPENVSAAENEVLRAFDRWSQQSRVSVTSIRPQWRRGDDDFMTLDCRADCFGSMEAIARFLFEMEKDSLPLRVEGLEITARDNGGQELALALHVSGLLLHRQNP
jgi:hypothetical protein